MHWFQTSTALRAVPACGAEVTPRPQGWIYLVQFLNPSLTQSVAASLAPFRCRAGTGGPSGEGAQRDWGVWTGGGRGSAHGDMGVPCVNRSGWIQPLLRIWKRFNVQNCPRAIAWLLASLVCLQEGGLADPLHFFSLYSPARGMSKAFPCRG